MLGSAALYLQVKEPSRRSHLVYLKKCSPVPWSLQIEMEKARYLDMARQGAVLVSPAISPGEKLIMRAAFDAGLPTIVLMENGFTPLTKPKGEQFDACAAGRLLLLAPWGHHNEKRAITSYQCQQLNLMAIEICDNIIKEEEV